MRTPTHFVSLRTYALAFAVALSPALFQTQFTCDRGDTRLSVLSVIVDGEDQIAFDTNRRAYDVWLPASTDSAFVRAIPVDLTATAWVVVFNDLGSFEAMTPAIGGGELVVPLEPGLNTIKAHVSTSRGARGSYTVDIRVGCDNCSDGEECTLDTCDPALEVCVHSPLADGAGCDFGGGIPGVCVGQTCTSVCTVIDCGSDYNDCTIDTCDPVGGCHTPVADGTPCAGGTCQTGVCELGSTVLPCTEQGIRNAIAAGGGPYTFDCAGPTSVATEAQIVIDNDVILDGEGLLTVDGRGFHPVFKVDRYVIAELHGFMVTGGSSTGGENGGGITNHGTLTVTDTTVSGNFSAGEGGGIYNDYGSLTIIDSTVSNNTADWAGGIVNGWWGGTLTITNSTVAGNTAYNWGGGIDNLGTLTVINSTVSGNTAGHGGGIWNRHEGVLLLANSTVSGNTATGDGYPVPHAGEGFPGAGGIVNEVRGVLTVVSSTVSGNTHSGIYTDNYDGSVSVTDSTVSGNTSAGIYVFRGSVALNNSTVSGNANYGIYCHTSTYFSANVTVVNSTISGSGVNAVYALSEVDTSTSIDISATLIDGACDSLSSANLTWISSGNNIESPGNTCGFDQASDQFDVTAAALSLGALQDNGGPTETHALLPGSVAIDWIFEADCVDANGNPLAIDQRGVTRPQGVACDVGAFELEQ